MASLLRDCGHSVSSGVDKILYRNPKLSAMPQQSDLLRMTKAACAGNLF
jgi:hypothetical protein